MGLQKGIGKLLGVLLVASFFNGLCWAGMIPMWQTPDEQAHFAQAQNMVVGKNAPGKGDPDASPTTSKDIVKSEEYLGTFRQNGNNVFTYHPENRIEYTDSTYGKHEMEIENLPIDYRREFVTNEATGYPPLYYGLVAGMNGLFWNNGLITRVFMSRILTVLISTLAIYVTYLLAGEIFKNKYLALATAAMVSFHPMWRFVESGVTSDALFNLIYPLLIFCMIKLIRGNKIYFWWTLAVFVLGLVTKLQVILLMPILVSIWIWIVVAGKRYGIFIQNMVKILLLAVLILLAVTVGNYLIPNFTFYWMEKLGLKWLVSTLFLPELSNFGDKVGFINYWKMMGKQIYVQDFPWYWGVYRWLSLTLPLWIYRIIKIAILISLAGWGLGILKWSRIKEKGKWIIENRGWIMILVSIVTYGVGLLTWNLFFWRSHGYSFGIQGRYFFPNLPEHMILLLGGLVLAGIHLDRFRIKQFGPELTAEGSGMTIEKILIFAIVLAMLMFNWYSLYFVSASYYDASNWNTFFIQASQYKPWFFKTPMLSVIVALGVFSSIWLLVSLIRYNAETQGK